MLTYACLNRFLHTNISPRSYKINHTLRLLNHSLLPSSSFLHPAISPVRNARINSENWGRLYSSSTPRRGKTPNNRLTGISRISIDLVLMSGHHFCGTLLLLTSSVSIRPRGRVPKPYPNSASHFSYPVKSPRVFHANTNSRTHPPG